jgi:hypothetical protein
MARRVCKGFPGMRKIVYTYQVLWWTGTHNAPGEIFATMAEASERLGNMSNGCITKIRNVVED